MRSIKTRNPRGVSGECKGRDKESSRKEVFPRLFFILVFSGRVCYLVTQEFEQGGKKESAELSEQTPEEGRKKCLSTRYWQT